MLVHAAAPVDGADVVLRLPRARLPALLAAQLGSAAHGGDQAAPGRLLAVLVSPDPDFAILTP